MAELTETTRIQAPRDDVWGLISDQRNWAIWTPARTVTLDREGSPEPDGVGAVRHMRVAGSLGAREEILAFEAPEYMSYRLLSQFPARNYVAHIRLSEDGDATRLEWSAEWEDRLGFAKGAIARFFSRSLKRFSAGIKAEAERRATADG